MDQEKIASMRLQRTRLSFLALCLLLFATNMVAITDSSRALSHVIESFKGGTVQSPQRRSKRPVIVLFGDSLTQRGFGEDGHVGWASLLASSYTRRADVKNRGFGGYNTHHALCVWPEVEEAFEDAPILFAVLFFGANDAALPGNPQHVPLEEYRDNLTKLLDHIRAKTSSGTPIFLFTPPPVDEVAWAWQKNATHSDRLNHVTRTYGEMVHQVAIEQQLPVVDTWEILEGHNHTAYSQYLSDGVHLSEMGNQRIHDGFMEVLRSNFPQLAPKTDWHPQGLPFQQKQWQEYE